MHVVTNIIHIYMSAVQSSNKNAYVNKMTVYFTFWMSIIWYSIFSILSKALKTGATVYINKDKSHYCIKQTLCTRKLHT